ncbi:hypothetical protein FA95DRAFT_1289467 [Auriscalpium vulgare]|uniref:Uncharacterized protein n=1 Tax=Auriscalpium vulgare TaxID=40419 RepID=A0ACB8RU10_9AGAM|nr:hypothetical protein FA95DRAFT_1289467 [Auriscalpium vulgare]
MANANTGSNTKRISLQDIIDAQRAEIIGPEEPVFPPLGVPTGTGVVFPPIGLPTGAVSNTNANTKRALAFIDGLPTNALNDIPVVFPTATSTDLAPTGTNPFRQYKFGPGPVIFPTETSTPTATSTDSPTGNTVEVPPAGPTFSFPSQQAVPTPIFPFQQPGVPTTGLIPL